MMPGPPFGGPGPWARQGEPYLVPYQQLPYGAPPYVYYGPPPPPPMMNGAVPYGPATLLAPSRAPPTLASSSILSAPQAPSLLGPPPSLLGPTPSLLGPPPSQPRPPPVAAPATRSAPVVISTASDVTTESPSTVSTAATSLPASRAALAPPPISSLESEALALRLALLEVIRAGPNTSASVQELLSTLRKSRLGLALESTHGGVKLPALLVDFGQLLPVATGAVQPTPAKALRTVTIENGSLRGVAVRVAVPPLGSNILQYTLRLAPGAVNARIIAAQDGSWIIPPAQAATVEVEA